MPSQPVDTSIAVWVNQMASLPDAGGSEREVSCHQLAQDGVTFELIRCIGAGRLRFHSRSACA